MTKFLKIAVIFVVNIMLLLSSGQSKTVYADKNPNPQYLYELKTATGEKIIKQNDKTYKCNICSNKSEAIFQVKLAEGSKQSDFIVTDENSTIIGSLCDGSPCLIKVNLKSGDNVVIIKNKKDNSQLYKIYVNYTNVQVKGLKDSVYTGDNLKLEVNNSDGASYKNVKWIASGINTVMITPEGNLTALNSGIANVIGTIYDESDNIIGNINIDFYVCGEKVSGWINNNGKWYYIDETTQTIKIGWIFFNGEWYHTDITGAMQTGWYLENGSWYYLKENGVMATSWIKDNEKWYLLDAGGVMKKGWVKDHGNCYYLNSDGSMQTSDKVIDGIEYKFNAHGELQNNVNNIK